MKNPGYVDPRESDEMSLMEQVFTDAVEDTKEFDGTYADDDQED
jgi:hypothetical protein